MKLSKVISTAGRGSRALGGPNSAFVRPLSSTAATSTKGLACSRTTTRPQQAQSTHLRSCNHPRPPTSQSHRSYASSSSSDTPLSRTALYDIHLAHGAKMVPFGGFEMPVQYAGLGVSASHHFTREKASLFDVGHMVQHWFEGPGATAFLQRITPGSLASLPVHQSTLSALLWPGTGGIVDDTIITRLGPERFYVVTNAACREKDLAYLKEQLATWDGPGVRHEVLDGWGLIALQGPLSEELLTQILEDPAVTKLHELYFGQSCFANIKGAKEPVLISRGGYTGEDGFEISINPADTVSVTETLLTAAGPEKLQFAGLGARDSLRLEAGMCLYGHDLDDKTTPVEGALGWIVGKDRRTPASDADKFHGADVVLAQLTPKSKGGSGVSRRRVGLTVEGAPAREGAEIVDPSNEGEKIGVVTSGCPSPTLGKNIAMGYVKDGLHKAGTELHVLVRGRPRKAVVTKMPFVPAKYHKVPA
ncbi:glycine cleavage system T protein [Xylaria bambusicola]|uniref:glycine cleavage system T protein n=1 Tax=Xylaria bambusicola TaxID=326684 RepID=UPI0020089361|nr:glycine cleavage system T protein [Xylaria bambusicola]KAI0505560.1 glycine cleavage system T protein [Xylaria bambusicola]